VVPRHAARSKSLSARLARSAVGLGTHHGNRARAPDVVREAASEASLRSYRTASPPSGDAARPRSPRRSLDGVRVNGHRRQSAVCGSDRTGNPATRPLKTRSADVCNPTFQRPSLPEQAHVETTPAPAHHAGEPPIPPSQWGDPFRARHEVSPEKWSRSGRAALARAPGSIRPFRAPFVGLRSDRQRGCRQLLRATLMPVAHTSRERAVRAKHPAPHCLREPELSRGRPRRYPQPDPFRTPLFFAPATSSHLTREPA
jgi:hypothetical protein